MSGSRSCSGSVQPEYQCAAVPGVFCNCIVSVKLSKRRKSLHNPQKPRWWPSSTKGGGFRPRHVIGISHRDRPGPGRSSEPKTKELRNKSPNFEAGS